MNIFIRKNDNDLLKYLDSEEIKAFYPIQEIIELDKGKLLDITVENKDDIYLVYEGAIKLFTKGKNVDEISIFDFFEGEIFGETNFLGFPLNVKVKAISNTRLVRYPKRKLIDVMLSNPKISVKIQAALNDSLAEKTIRITRLTHN